MSYVGMATATGQVVEVPIVLRSLAASLAQVPRAELPIPFDLGFVAMLEVGTNVEQFGRVVKAYEHSWWKATRSPAEGRYLNAQTLEQCLTRHRAQLLKSMEGDKVAAMEIHTIAPLQIRSMKGADSSRRADDLGRADAPGRADSPRRPNTPCPECEVYRSLAGDLLEELRGIKQFASGVRAAASNDLEVATRRTGGFYQLHEKVNLKEMSSESLTVEGTGLGTRPTRMSRRVSQIAADDLERFRDMPSSHKWTWGEALTEQDILGLQHVSKQREHTGYDTSLPLGLLPGEYSATHTTPSTSAHFSIIPPDPQLPPPPTSLRYPANLGSYRINASSNPADSLSARDGSMDAIAAMWPSDGEQSVDGHGAARSRGAGSHAVLHGAVQVAPFESPAQHSAGASAAIAAEFWPENDTSDGTEDQQSPAALAAAAADFWPDYRSAEEASEEQSDGNNSEMDEQFSSDNDAPEEESPAAVAQAAAIFWSDDGDLEQEPQEESVAVSVAEAGYYWLDPEEDSDGANADLPNAEAAEDVYEDSAQNAAAEAAALWFGDEQPEAATDSSRDNAAAIAASFWDEPMDSDSQRSHTPPISPSHVQDSNDTISAAAAAAAGMSQDPSTSKLRKFTPSDFDNLQTPWFTHEISDEDSDIDEEPDEEPDVDEGLDLEQMSLVD